MTTRRLWWATLVPSSPRYLDWYTILDSDNVPLLYPGAAPAKLGEQPDKIDVFQIDLSKMTEPQIDRLVRHVMNRFRAPEAAVRDAILQDGFPIRAVDVSLAFDMRAFA